MSSRTFKLKVDDLHLFEVEGPGARSYIVTLGYNGPVLAKNIRDMDEGRFAIKRFLARLDSIHRKYHVGT